MDARSRRSLERLSAAVLTLAADAAVQSLSVTEIARAAGVHRSTFYEHSDSPAHLLRTTLLAELDETRGRHLAGEEPRDWGAAVRTTTLDVLDHLERHQAVYLRSLADPADGTLSALLSEHFCASVVLLLDRGIAASPVTDHHVAARFIADGVVGAVTVWLSGTPLRDRNDFLEDLGRLVPPWWPLSPGWH